MAIAPWLQPPNVLGAIEAGTRAGLAIRQQDTSEIENADRLQLAYDQLNAENQRANESARLRAELASQTLQQRQQEQDALNQYRMGGLDLRAQTVEQQAQTAQQRDQTARAAIEQRAAAAAALDARQRDLMQQRQTFQENKPVTPALTANEVLGKIQQTKEALAATDMTPEKAQTVLNQQADLIDYLKKNFSGVPTPTPSTFDVVTPEVFKQKLVACKLV